MQLQREYNAEQTRIRNENIKKYNAYLKKQEELKKQKRIDANDLAREANEAYAKKVNNNADETTTPQPSLIIKKTTIKK